MASGWTPGGEVIPTDFTEKVQYFIEKFGKGKETQENNSEAAKVTESPTDKPLAKIDPIKKDVVSEDILVKDSENNSSTPTASDKSTTESKGPISSVEKSPENSGTSFKSATSGQIATKSAGSASDPQKSPLLSTSDAAEDIEKNDKEEKKGQDESCLVQYIFISG